MRIRQREDGQDYLNTTEQLTVHCGTGIVESMIIFPWMWVGAWLDVADGLGRFEVLPAHRHVAEPVTIFAQAKAERAPTAAQPAGRSSAQHFILASRLPAGTYDVTLVLNNRRGFCGDFLPLPVGWKLYDQSVEAATTIRVTTRSSQYSTEGFRRYEASR